MIYLDNSATTYIKPEVLNEMMPYLKDNFGNPSSIYNIGRDNYYAIEKSRKIIANYLNCKSNEIYFTSSGSESDNWAIKGIAFANRNKGNHIITSKIEHKAVLNSCKFLESLGYKITYLNVDRQGVINLEELQNSITNKTILVSIMTMNNEIGSIQPIEEIGKIIKQKNIYFHTDAVQAIDKVNFDLQRMNIDLLSFSGHKIHAPKGIGVLYIKEGTNIENLLHGGKQESGMRAGTENVAYIVGLGKAVELLSNSDKAKIYKLKNKLINELQNNFQCKINGCLDDLTNIVSVTFSNLEAESLMLLLSLKEIYISGGSACNKQEKSHVLHTIGLSDDEISKTVRISLCSDNTKEEINVFIHQLKEIITKTNNMRNKI